MCQNRPEFPENSSNKSPKKGFYQHKVTKKLVTHSLNFIKGKGFSHIREETTEETTEGVEPKDGNSDEDDGKAPPKDPKLFKLIGACSGIVFLGTILFFILLNPCISVVQIGFIKIFIALAGGAFSLFFTGSAKAKTKFFTATGTFAVFVIIFLSKPAMISGGSTCQKIKFKGIFYLNNKLKKGIQVIIPQLPRTETTNEMGIIEFEVPYADFTLPTDIECRYKDLLDTNVTIQSLSPVCKLICPGESHPD